MCVKICLWLVALEKKRRWTLTAENNGKIMRKYIYLRHTVRSTAANQSHYSVPTWGSNPRLPTWKLITLSTRAKIGVTAHSRCTSDVGALEAYSDTPAWFSTVTDHWAALEVWAHNLWEHTFTYSMLFDRQLYKFHYSVPTWGLNPRLPTWKLITLSTRAKIGVTAHDGCCTSDVGALEAYSDIV